MDRQEAKFLEAAGRLDLGDLNMIGCALAVYRAYMVARPCEYDRMDLEYADEAYCKINALIAISYEEI